MCVCVRERDTGKKEGKEGGREGGRKEGRKGGRERRKKGFAISILKVLENKGRLKVDQTYKYRVFSLTLCDLTSQKMLSWETGCLPLCL